MQYNYESPGVLQPGEAPTSSIDTAGLLRQQVRADQITEQERIARMLEIVARESLDYRFLDEYRGQGFIGRCPAAARFLFFQQPSAHERPQNRWLMFIGALLAFGRLVGFVVEARLRQRRLPIAPGLRRRP